MAEKAPSTMGTLLGSAFVELGKQFKEETELSFDNFIQLIETMIKGIIKRGNAQLGDKTILDSLIPAWEQLKNSVENGEGFKQSIENVYVAAENGMKETVHMTSKKGRAARYLDNSKENKILGQLLVL